MTTNNFFKKVAFIVFVWALTDIWGLVLREIARDLFHLNLDKLSHVTLFAGLATLVILASAYLIDKVVNVDLESVIFPELS